MLFLLFYILLLLGFCLVFGLRIFLDYLRTFWGWNSFCWACFYVSQHKRITKWNNSSLPRTIGPCGLWRRKAWVCFRLIRFRLRNNCLEILCILFVCLCVNCVFNFNWFFVHYVFDFICACSIRHPSLKNHKRWFFSPRVISFTCETRHF